MLSSFYCNLYFCFCSLLTNGRMMVKVAPLPSVLLLAYNFSLCTSTIFLEIYRPNPVPLWDLMENFEIIYNLLAVTMSLTWYTEYVLKHLHNIWHVNLAFTILATYIHVLKLNADLDIMHKDLMFLS